MDIYDQLERSAIELRCRKGNAGYPGERYRYREYTTAKATRTMAGIGNRQKRIFVLPPVFR